MEHGKPLHRLDRCGPHAARRGGSEARRTGPQGSGLRLRLRLHLGAQARDQVAVARARGDGSDVDPGAPLLALERAPLRRIAGARQGRDGREVRRGTGAPVAPQLRRAASRARARRSPPSARRPALCRARRRRAAAHRVPEGHRRAISPLLERDHRAEGPRGRADHHRRAREQPARPRQVSGRGERRGHRRLEHPHGDSPRLRARCGAAARSSLLSRRPGGMSGRFWAVLLLAPVLALAQGTKESQQLEALRERIDELRAKISESEESRTEARDQLHESERAISDGRAVAQTQLAALTRRARGLEDEIASRRESLGRLLTSRYLDGEQSALKLLFSGEDPGGIARELYYYSHVSRAQAEFIRELGSSLEQLHKLEAGAREKSAELAAIESAARKERSALLKEQAERRGVLERVSVQLREQRRQVKQLERDESRLSRLVEELGRVIAATPLLRNDKVPEPGGAEGPLAGLKRGLRLPIKGELANRFGAQRQSGGPSWKGLFIRSPSGQEVRSVAPGRIVFSDWLRGFGNLLIIDHGLSYLTIYGNNESVLKQVGELVHTGEAVATVGASGGNTESGLYFEIRHEGKAFDPMRWVSLK